MSLKKFDLAKNLGLKIDARRKAAAVPGRFADEAAAVLDKREQRRRAASARSRALAVCSVETRYSTGLSPKVSAVRRTCSTGVPGATPSTRAAARSAPPHAHVPRRAPP
jgi:hypothetical protein